MKNPAGFEVDDPIPLKPDVKREFCLSNAQFFSNVHIPYKKNKGKLVEIATGNRHYAERQGSQGTLLCI